jgi:hypothetical protein
MAHSHDKRLCGLIGCLPTILETRGFTLFGRSDGNEEALVSLRIFLIKYGLEIRFQRIHGLIMLFMNKIQPCTILYVTKVIQSDRCWEHPHRRAILVGYHHCASCVMTSSIGWLLSNYHRDTLNSDGIYITMVNFLLKPCSRYYSIPMFDSKTIRKFER